MARLRLLCIVITVLGAMTTAFPRSAAGQAKPKVSDATLTLTAGDQGKISLEGRSLGLFARAEVISVDSGRKAKGVTAILARARGSSRSLTLRSESGAASGDYTVNVVSRIRRRTYTLDFTLTVKGDETPAAAPPPAVSPRPTAVTRRPTQTPRARPTQPTRRRPTAATRPVAARNRPPRVITVTPPDDIEADAAFGLIIRASDDQGLSDVTVAWQGGSATEEFSGGQDETVTVSIPGFAAGTQTISVIVRDGAGRRGTAWTGLLRVTVPVVVETPFQLVSVTSSPLVMTGDRFQPVSVTSSPLVMTGDRFQPVSVTSSPLVMTGDRFQPVSVTSSPLVMTGAVEEEVVEVDEPPTIDAFDVPAEAEANTDVTVVVTASDDVGLARIDVLYSSDNRPGRPSLVRLALSGETTVTETLILENVSEGTQAIRVLVHDEAGSRLLGSAQMIVASADPEPVLDGLEVPSTLAPGESGAIVVTLDRAVQDRGVEVAISLGSKQIASEETMIRIAEGETRGEITVTAGLDLASEMEEDVIATLGDVRLTERVLLTTPPAAPVAGPVTLNAGSFMITLLDPSAEGRLVLEPITLDAGSFVISLLDPTAAETLVLEPVTVGAGTFIITLADPGGNDNQE